MEFALGLIFLIVFFVSGWAAFKSVRVLLASRDDSAMLVKATGTRNLTAAKLVASVALAVFAPIFLALLSFLVVAGYQMANH
jgi:hypothetical protein